MSVRAKFHVTKIEQTPGSSIGEILSTVHLSPVFGASGTPKDNDENKKFFKYTPSGGMTLGTVNPKAAEYFVCGREYYIDFTDATPAPAEEV